MDFKMEMYRYPFNNPFQKFICTLSCTLLLYPENKLSTMLLHQYSII